MIKKMKETKERTNGIDIKHFLIKVIAAVWVLLFSITANGAEKIVPVPFTDVKIADEFWAPRMETNRRVTIPYAFKKCEETGRISNFANAGGLKEGDHEGAYYNDSDLYKIMEGAAYSLQVSPDPNLKKYLDDLLDVIGKAQWEDGYLYTFYSVPMRQPEKRWTKPILNEMYCAGHMYEAAVAHYLTMGDKKFLNIAIKNADLVCEVFGPGRKEDPSSHPEIEIGLCKLYCVTGDKKYLYQAKFFLDQRGRLGNRGPNGKGGLYGTFYQDHIPVTEQTTAVGHTVCAMYLYSAMAEVLWGIIGDPGYRNALELIWQDVVSTKMFITGGLGLGPYKKGFESFTETYHLPNEKADVDTCTAIGMVFWNHRMNLLRADARYVDVLERALYNRMLAGVSLDGKQFFYGMPHATPGPKKFFGGGGHVAERGRHRQPWFGCACCPTNVVRFFPAIGQYIYTHSDDAIYVNLYVAGSSKMPLKGMEVKLTQQTRYPWDGRVKLTLSPAKPESFDLCLRIPGWCKDRQTPGGLYRVAQSDEQTTAATVNVNGQAVDIDKLDQGYLRISRRWKPGDTVELNLPMPIHRIHAHPKVEADVGRVALQRGPIVYCVEDVDHDVAVKHLVLPPEVSLSAEYRPDLLGGVTVITGKAAVRVADSGRLKQVDLLAIPFYAWDNRQPGGMAVWLPEDPNLCYEIDQAIYQFHDIYQDDVQSIVGG